MSLISKNELEGNKVELEIGVSAEDFEKAVERAYQKNKNKIAVQGFRKGKAPRKMIEKMYGEGCFYEDAINLAVPYWVGTVIEEEKLNVIDRPELDISSIDKNEGVVLKAVCQLRPVAEVSDYKGIEVEKVDNTVSEEDVQKEISKLLDRNARLISIDNRPAQMGDTIVFDFDGYMDGERFDGGQAEKFNLVLGSNHFIPGFEEQIVGHEVGEEFSVNVSFPEDYHMEDLKGKPAEFKIKLHEISFKELPELDDELVQEATEFENVVEYKANLMERLNKAAERKAETEFGNKLFEKLLTNVKVEVPEVMIEAKIDEMIRDFEHRLSQQGIDLNTYLAYSGMEFESFKKTFADGAEVQVKLRLAFEKIADLENITADDQEVENEMIKMSEIYNIPFEQVKSVVHPLDVQADIRVGKAAKLVRESAVTL